ncbi:MAG: MFS transporter [Bacteroidia bacterium]|nr:MFS transporter [Bacteroidia bacterium]
MKRNRNLILLMLASEFIFLLPFVMARIFRPTFLKVFQLTNFELGSAFSIYGVVAMISYFVGGPIADRYSPRKLIAASLLLTAAGGLIMKSIPSIHTLTMLYAFWGISTILLFWAASVKAIRMNGGSKQQGMSFGLVDAGRGFIAAALASVSVLLFEAFLPVDVEVASLHQLEEALGTIILCFSGLIVFIGLLIWFILHDTESEERESPLLSWTGVRSVIKNPMVWLQSIIVLCSYVGYKCTDDFSLYASEVLGYNDVEAAHVGTVSFWVRPLAALAAGFLGDRKHHSLIIRLCFLVVLIGSLGMASGMLQPGMVTLSILTIAFTSAGIYGLRGLYFALFQEASLPLIVTGSAVGVVSLIGYTPDVFMGPLMGYLLDSSPGVQGHQHVFAVLAFFCIPGYLATQRFSQLSKRPSQ